MDEDLKKRLRAKFAFMIASENSKKFHELILNSIKKGESESNLSDELKAREERLKLN